MKALQILGSVPSFFEIFMLIGYSEQSKCVFEETYLFKNGHIPSDEEFELLDANELRIDGKLVLDPKSVILIGDRMRSSANCIHVYTAPQLDTATITFRNMNWEWAYYNHDDSTVELFFNMLDSSALFESVIMNYRCMVVDFPGLISAPGGMSCLL